MAKKTGTPKKTKPVSPKKTGPKNNTFFKRIGNFLKHFAFYFTVLVILSGIALSTYLIIFSNDLPDVEVLRTPNFDLPTVIYDRNGTQVYDLSIEKRIIMSKENLPDVVKEALIAIEDSRFYSHPGVDAIRIVKAAIVNFKAGRIVEGASTITQQTAKLFFLTPEKSFKRKIMEALLALKIEKNFEKDEILELYLNKAYFGRHSRGIEAAAQQYFSKSSKLLTVDEAAFLVGLLKAPSSLSPTRNMEGAVNRRNVVLRAMLRNDFISSEEYEIYSKKKLVIAPGNPNFYPETEYYVDEIRKFLKKFGKIDVNTAGYKVYTYMDLKMQIYAQKALKRGLEGIQKRKGFSESLKNVANDDDISQAVIDKTVEDNINETDEIVTGIFTKVEKESAEIIIGPNEYGFVTQEKVKWALPDEKSNLTNRFKFGDIARFKVGKYNLINKSFELDLYVKPEINGGIIAMDPRNGEVLAVVGGYNFTNSQFNRATQSNRQTGSAFKPILYATALENGYTLASILNDNPYASDEEDSVWRPTNYSNSFSGFLPFRDALVFSKNVPTVRLLEDIGLSPLFDTINRLGISKDKFKADYSIALGSASLTPEELTVAYTAFANGGYLVDRKYIKKIVDRNGVVLYDTETTPSKKSDDGLSDNTSDERKRVFSPETAFLMTSALQDVIERGTGRRAAAIGRAAAGKTGTANNYSDAWFVGYIPQLIAGVFIGNDLPSIPIGDREGGGRAALPVWLDFMKNATRRMTIENFKQPPGIITAKINPDTGYLICSEATENERFEYFKTGTEPTVCDQNSSPYDNYNTENTPSNADGEKSSEDSAETLAMEEL